MEPVVTPAEMAAIDAAAPEPVAELIERAGRAVARAALDLLGGGYGKRVVVIAGKGNNGADGRAAALVLARRGVRCRIVTPDDPGPFGPGVDLVIDAAYGTGFRGTHRPAVVTGVPVLAVDIPSGVDGLTGEVGGAALAATATVTFAAPKPGLLLAEGRRLAGPVTVADIGLDCGAVTTWHLGPSDVADHWPVADPDGHKWQRAVWVIGGAPTMPGAPALAARSAARGGAGYVTVSVPGADRIGPPFPVEAVLRPLPAAVPPAPDRVVGSDVAPDRVVGSDVAVAPDRVVGSDLPPAPVAPGRVVGADVDPDRSVGSGGDGGWGGEVVAAAGRHGALVIGPGLATDAATGACVRAVVAGTPDRGLVLDGGALDALVDPNGGLRADAPALLGARAVPAVLTPHDGELARLLGRRPGPDRIAEVRALAARCGAVVLAKGPATVAAHPDGRVLISTAGDRRLATAGTGDVLAGLVGAALAGGLDPLLAAGLAAELHGSAAGDGRCTGFVAGDLPDLVADRLDRELSRRGGGSPRPVAGDPDAGHPDAGSADAGHPDAGSAVAGSAVGESYGRDAGRPGRGRDPR